MLAKAGGLYIATRSFAAFLCLPDRRRQRNILGNQLLAQNREINASAAGAGYISYHCIVKKYVTDV
jgi:hypothetical protein